jgi:hypothetical protein
MDAHVHFICPQICEVALFSGLTTMLGGVSYILLLLLLLLSSLLLLSLLSLLSSVLLMLPSLQSFLIFTTIIVIVNTINIIFIVVIIIIIILLLSTGDGRTRGRDLCDYMYSFSYTHENDASSFRHNPYEFCVYWQGQHVSPRGTDWHHRGRYKIQREKKKYFKFFFFLNILKYVYIYIYMYIYMNKELLALSYARIGAPHQLLLTIV